MHLVLMFLQRQINFDYLISCLCEQRVLVEGPGKLQVQIFMGRYLISNFY